MRVKIKEKILECRDFFARGDALYDKIERWLIYGVALSLAPYFVTLLLFKIIGYKVNILDMLPDYLLVTFAVAVNAHSYASDEKKCVGKRLRKFSSIFSAVTMSLTFVVYFGLFNDNFISSAIYDLMKKNTSNIADFNKYVRYALYVNIIIGVIVEISDFFGDKKKQGNNPNLTEGENEQGSKG